MQTRSKNSFPIHTWVLVILVVLCLAFGLSPFVELPIAGESAPEGATPAPGPRGTELTVGSHVGPPAAD